MKKKKLYVAMAVRGEEGNNVSRETMYENKGKAIATAKIIRDAIGEWYDVIVPHKDAILDAIDETFLDERDEDLVELAMMRCHSMLDKCHGIVALGIPSNGMKSEVGRATTKGKFVYENNDTRDFLEDLVLSLNDHFGIGEKDDASE